MWKRSQATHAKIVAICASQTDLTPAIELAGSIVRPFIRHSWAGTKARQARLVSHFAYFLSEVSIFFWCADSGYFSLNSSARS